MNIPDAMTSPTEQREQFEAEMRRDNLDDDDLRKNAAGEYRIGSVREEWIRFQRYYALGAAAQAERVADLQRQLAAERESCAKVCEEWGAWNETAQAIAAAIRARGGGR